MIVWSLDSPLARTLVIQDTCPQVTVFIVNAAGARAFSCRAFRRLEYGSMHRNLTCCTAGVAVAVRAMMGVAGNISLRMDKRR